MKYKFAFAALIFLSVMCFYIFHLIYTDAKEKSIAELNSQQKIHARLAKKGIEDFFENLLSLATKISESTHVIRLDEQGKNLLEFSLSSFPKTIAAITRVDKTGRITYTVPYNESVIGSDISGQEHVQEIFRTRQPVVGDIFTAVQGYRAIAVHVPLFNGEEFDGTLGILVDFNTISKRYLDEIQIGETGYAWMTSSEGTEIYCPVPGHIGQSVFETGQGFPTLISMAEKMVQGEQGVTTYSFYKTGHKEQLIKKHAVYLPIKVVNSYWALVVSASEEEVLLSLSDFKNKILVVAVLLLLLSIAFVYYSMRAWGVLRERKVRLKAEKKLRASEHFLNSVIENIPNMLFVKDAKDLRFVRFNKAGERLLGYPKQNFIGKTDYDFFGRKQADFFIVKDREVLAGKHLLDIPEEPIKTKDGDTKILHTKKIPILDEKGDALFLLGISEDITERKRAEKEKAKLEEQLRQAHKMEAIGTLAGGIAHDFNNILSAIIGYAQLAQLDIPRSNAAKEHIKEVLKASNRAKELVQHILTFSRKESSVFSPIKVDRVARESLKLLRATLPTTIEIKENISSDCGHITGNATQLNQVFMNLCTNAAQAMEKDGGYLNVIVQPVVLRDADLAIRTERAEQNSGKYIKISVCDTGIGIAPNIIDRIFDPYFTTKETGKGSGMGLAVTHGIVKNFGGFIEVNSEQGKGSCFVVYFPVLENVNAFNTVSSKTTQNVSGGSERILVIDDEAPLAELASQWLKHLGYNVITQTDSKKALELFRKNPDSFDLIITDQTMPKMTGEKLSREMLKIRKDIPVILYTGYSSSVNEEKAKELGIRAFLMKPLQYDAFGMTVRQVLEENKELSS